jgi:hypothetical protein
MNPRRRIEDRLEDALKDCIVIKRIFVQVGLIVSSVIIIVMEIYHVFHP